VGDHRFRYNLSRDGKPVKRILSDSEARFAIVSLSPTLSMELRRSASEISRQEIENHETHIINIITE
jgi:hypothetical protein